MVMSWMSEKNSQIRPENKTREKKKFGIEFNPRARTERRRKRRRVVYQIIFQSICDEISVQVFFCVIILNTLRERKTWWKHFLFTFPSLASLSHSFFGFEIFPMSVVFSQCRRWCLSASANILFPRISHFSPLYIQFSDNVDSAQSTHVSWFLLCRRIKWRRRQAMTYFGGNISSTDDNNNQRLFKTIDDVSYNARGGWV